MLDASSALFIGFIIGVGFAIPATIMSYRTWLEGQRVKTNRK